jgi:hypothetical protein
MRREYGTRLRKQFTARLKESLPQFERLPPSDSHPSAWVLYEWIVAPSLHFYLDLRVPKSGDAFWVEVIWTTCSKLPFASPQTWQPDDDPVDGTLEFDLSRFWKPLSGPEMWWIVPELSLEERMRRWNSDEYLKDPSRDEINAAVARIPRLVDDAIRKVNEYAIPYFHKIALKYGCENQNSVATDQHR